MSFILYQAIPVNGSKNFPIESTIKLTFNKDVDSESVNSGTITLINRDTNEVISSAFQVSGAVATLRPAVSLSEETAYKINVIGTDIQQPLGGYLSAKDGDPLLYSQTIFFETAKRVASPVVNQDLSKTDVDIVYIYDDEEATMVAKETQKLVLLGSTPENSEMFISPAFLAENGIRLHFNRPVDLESAKKYVSLSHSPLAGIRAMAYSPDGVQCSYDNQSEQNFCIDGRNEKLHPSMNYYIQGNDLLLTYANTIADIDAQNWIDPGVDTTPEPVIPPFVMVTPDPAVEPDYDFSIFGELVEETHRFNFGQHAKAWLTMESHFVKDRYKVQINNKIVYDSGCMSTNGTPLIVEIDLTAYTAFHVTVIGRCDPTETVPGTAWSFRVTSFDPSLSSSSASSSSGASSSSSGISSSSSDSSSSDSSSSGISSSSSIVSSSSESSSSSSSVAYDACVAIGPVLNAEVRISVNSNLKSQPDDMDLTSELGVSADICFLMGMFPLYSDVDSVRLDLDNLNARYPDEQILRVILKTSLEAWNLACNSFDLCAPPEDAILYAEYKSILNLYDLTFASGAMDRGKALHLGDWSARTGARASNSTRSPKENELRQSADYSLAVLRALCPATLGIRFAIKGKYAPTTKSNFRIRTYKYLSNEDMWLAPAIKGANRYFDLPHFGQKFS